MSKAERQGSADTRQERSRKQAKAGPSSRTEEHFRHLVEEINDVLFALYEDGKIDYISPALTALSGYRPEEMIGRNFAEFVHPDDLAELVHSFRRVVDGAVEPSEFRVLHKDGSIRWVRSSSRQAWLRSGVKGTRGVLTDVTERRQAEQLLRESEARFRALLEHSSDLVMLLDEGGIIRYVSPNISRLLGYDDQELIGRNAFDLVHPADVDVLLATFQEVVRQPGTNAIRVYRYRHNDGSWRWMEGVGTNVGGEIEGGAVIVNNRDVTDRHRAEEEARQRLAELAHVLRVGAVDEMASGLAHEINQPLAAIVNYASGALRRLEAEQAPVLAQFKQALDEIAGQAIRAGDIVHGLKRFVRKEPPRKEPVDLNRLVGNVVRLVENEVRQLDIALRCELAEDLPNIQGDGVQLEQVIFNLLHNGIEAIRRKGASGLLSVRTARDGGDGLQMAIADNGEGLPSGRADQIFEPFQTTKPGGLGMGLSIARTIVEAHGGRIWAEPNQGGGARFLVTFAVGAAAAVKRARMGSSSSQ